MMLYNVCMKQKSIITGYAYFFLLFLPSLWIGCKDTARGKMTENRFDIPEPDKSQRLRYEAIEKLKKSGCDFNNPDTSTSGIKISDAKSTILIIGNKDKIDTTEKYHYYSKTHKQLLTLTQHPGDINYTVSIFKVEYAGTTNDNYRSLEIGEFSTEKNIKLGISKKQVTAILGNCYAVLDSTEKYIEIYYLIEKSGTSPNRFLDSYNMPLYYASYRFRNDSLKVFEFGFEYP